MSQVEPPRQRPDGHCFLCGKTRQEVRKLIVGEMGGICFDCVGLCVGVVEADAASEMQDGRSGDSVGVADGVCDSGQG